MDELDASGMDDMFLSLFPSSPSLGTITSEAFGRDTSPLPMIDFDFEVLSSPEEIQAIMDCFIRYDVWEAGWPDSLSPEDKHAHGNRHSVSFPSLPPSLPPSPLRSPPPSPAPFSQPSPVQDSVISLEDHSRHGEPPPPPSYVCPH